MMYVDVNSDDQVNLMGMTLKEAVALQKILDNAGRGEFLMFYRVFVELGQIIERMK